MVNKPLLLQTFTNSQLNHQVNGSLLEHTGPNPFLNVSAAAIFNDHRLDAVSGEQMRKHQSGRTGTYDSDLRAE